MKLLLSTFYSDKAPIVLTFLAAAIAWAIVHTSETLAETPFLEYSLHTEKGKKSGTVAELRFRNITRNFTFRCLNVLLLAPKATREDLFAGVSAIEVRSVLAPIIEIKGASQPGEFPFSIKNMVPGADVSLKVDIKREAVPSLSIAACEDGSEKVPRIVKSSLQTWFVEHEFEAIWGSIVVWFVLVMVTLSTVPAQISTNGDKA